jgi:hypothetical protein
VEQQVEKVLDEKERGELPRFESSIDVEGESPQTILDRRLRPLDLECGPAGGPPTEAETRAVRPHQSPSADLLALGKLLAGMAKGKGQERFFLYRVRRNEAVTYLVREGRMPDAEFYNTVGATFELLAGFADAKRATDAITRLERGFEAPVGPELRGPVPPWVTSPCRPRK